MKILEALKALTIKDVLFAVVAIVVLAPGLKAGLALVSGGVAFLAAAVK